MYYTVHKDTPYFQSWARKQFCVRITKTDLVDKSLYSKLNTEYLLWNSGREQGEIGYKHVVFSIRYAVEGFVACRLLMVGGR